MSEWIADNEATAAATVLLIGVAGMLSGWRWVRGTTLVAPWCWGLLSLLAVGGTEVALASTADGPPAAWWSHARFAAAATTFCPTVALLGAKRPQSRAWQFIVASLWIVVVLPSGEALLYVPDRPLDLHDARRWFLLILIAVGSLNGLPTRFWPSVGLFTLAQLWLLRDHLPLVRLPSLGFEASLPGLTAAVVAVMLVVIGWPRAKRAASAFDRMWYDFRDAYGAMWALRVAERLNAVATTRRWNLTLGWNGLTTTGSDGELIDVPLETRRAMDRVFVGLLRRFVSDRWIQQRRDPAAVFAEGSGGEA